MRPHISLQRGFDGALKQRPRLTSKSEIKIISGVNCSSQPLLSCPIWVASCYPCSGECRTGQDVAAQPDTNLPSPWQLPPTPTSLALLGDQMKAQEKQNRLWSSGWCQDRAIRPPLTSRLSGAAGAQGTGITWEELHRSLSGQFLIAPPPHPPSSASHRVHPHGNTSGTEVSSASEPHQPEFTTSNSLKTSSWNSPHSVFGDVSMRITHPCVFATSGKGKNQNHCLIM